MNSARLLALGAILMLGPSCLCAPTAWRDEDGPALGPACDPATGRCWDLLPPYDDPRDNYVVEQEAFYDRAQPGIHARAAEQTTDTWQRAQPGYATDAAPKSPPRHAKKDAFMSHGWGAGGMPFSVLYMKPRAGHLSSSGSGQPEASRAADSTRRGHGESATGRPGRPAQRNPGSGQPRRHYSIIPQLFISYGWGPSGK